MKPNIDYITHDIGAQQMASFFPGLESSELPDGEGWAIEFVQLCTHNGTHLDAPYHFHPTMNEQAGGKERAITIDEVLWSGASSQGSSWTSGTSPTAMW